MHNNVTCRKRAVPSRRLKPFIKEESHEVKEYGNGCCYVQKKVLLTGFAEIAKSKRCRRTAIKLFVYFLCTSGFLYQTWEFLQMYLAYPTTLDTSEEYPDSFMQPAITICNKNRILRQPFCKTYPEECTFEYTTWETFCDKYRRMCPNTKPPDFNFGIPVFKYLDSQNVSNAFINAVGPQGDSNPIQSCILIKNSQRIDCNTLITFMQVHKNGFPYKCFSLFSLLVEPSEEPSNLTVMDEYVIQFDMHPEEYFNTIDPIEAMVVLHDPRKFVNPMTEGIPLTGGKLHQLFPSMERRESLPPPYASNCTDYLIEWKKNGGYGPVSKDDCIDLCKIEAMVDKYGCVGNTMTYPHKFQSCERGNIHAPSEVSRRCADSCQDACQENIYHVTSETITDVDAKCNETDEHCKSQYLFMRVTFNRMKIRNLKQIPRIESMELFSYIGGYLGMWLGISLAAVYDFGEMIYNVINSAFLKRKRKEKLQRRLNNSGIIMRQRKKKSIVKRRKLS